jgi:hypothetical protein
MKSFLCMFSYSRALVCGALLVCAAQSLSATVVKSPNPFGVLLNASEGPYTEILNADGSYSSPPNAQIKVYEKLRGARQLSAPILRLRLDVYNWMHQAYPSAYPVDNGKLVTDPDYVNYDERRQSQLDQYKTYVNTGARIALNINWGGPDVDYPNVDPKHPVVFPGPTDLDPTHNYYKGGLAKLLNDLNNYTSETGFAGAPELIVVQNEEMNLTELDHSATGTAWGWPDPQTNVAHYLAELAQLIDVVRNGLNSGGIVYPAAGHSLPSIGIANGGIIEAYMQVLIWDWYKNGGGPGNPDTFAADFMDNTLFSTVGTVTQLTSKGNSKLATAKWFLDGIGGYAGYTGLNFDYSNFHWYGPRKSGYTAAQAAPELDHYKAFLNFRLPLTAAITNEIGSQASHRESNTTVSSDAVTAILTKVHDDLSLPYIVWYSGNSDDFYAPAKPLENYLGLTDDEGNLYYSDSANNGLPDHTSPNFDGIAFHDFITAPGRYTDDAWITHPDSVVYGPFTFTGTRTGWFGSTTGTLSIASSTLKMVTNPAAAHVLVYGQPWATAAILETVGDQMIADFKLQLAGTIAATDSFSVGLFNSKNVRVSTDGHNGAGDDVTSFRNYDGYRAKVLPATGSNSSITFDKRVPATTGTASLVCTNTAYPVIGTPVTGPTMTTTSPYYFRLTVERTALRQVLVTLAAYSDSLHTALTFTSAGFCDLDPALYADGDESPFLFDTFAVGAPGDTMSWLTLDDVSLTYRQAATATAMPVAGSGDPAAVIGTTRTVALNLTAGTFPQEVSWFAANQTSAVRGPNTLASAGTDTLTANTAGTFNAVVTNPAGQAFVGPFYLWNATVVNSISGSSATYGSGVYSMIAGTGNIGGTSDKLYWLRQPALSHAAPVDNSTTIIARISYADATNGNAAGITIRGLPLDAQTKNIFVGVVYTGGAYSLVAQYRTTGGAGTSSLGSAIGLTGGTGWVKLVWKADGSFAAYGSSSTSQFQAPSTWTQFGTDTTAVAITNSTACLGFGAAHGGPTGTLAVSFSNVSVTMP